MNIIDPFTHMQLLMSKLKEANFRNVYLWIQLEKVD